MDQGRLLAIAALPVFPLFTPNGNRGARCTQRGTLAGVLMLQNRTLSYATKLGSEFSCDASEVRNLKAPGAMGCRFGPGFELQCTLGARQYWFGPMVPLRPDAHVDEVLAAIRPVARWKKLEPKLIAGAIWETARDMISQEMLGDLVGSSLSAALGRSLEVADPAAEIRRHASAEFKPAYAFRDALAELTSA